MRGPHDNTAQVVAAQIGAGEVVGETPRFPGGKTLTRLCSC